MMAVKGSTGEKEDNRLTQCFDEILQFSAELLTQQQLKTIKLDPKVTTGFSKTQQRMLGDRMTTFYSLLDTLEVSLQTTADYVDAVKVNAMELKKQREEEEIKRQAQEKIQRELLEQQRAKEQEQQVKQQAEQQAQQAQQEAQQQRYSAKSTPMDMLTNFDSELPSAGVAQSQPFSSEFADLNGMDLSMFDEAGFSGLQSAPASTDKKPDSQVNFNDTNAPPSAVGVPESANPNSYLTLNDFNDLGIDWNAANDNAELNLEDFSM